MDLDSKFLETVFNITNLLDDAHSASKEGDIADAINYVEEAEDVLQFLKEILGGNQ